MRKLNKGVTLVELIVVMLVIGILAAIAVPGYRNYVIRANRAEAKATLLSAAAGLEKCYTRFNAYDDENCEIAETLADEGIATEHGNYVVTAVVERNTFDLTATPQGGQVKDAACANLTLDHTNTKDTSGTSRKEDCWGR